MEPETDEPVQDIRITASLNRNAVEALRLEIRRLAKRHGLEIEELRTERVEGET
ncbi:MAG TPA: hypothetical protein VGW35_23660 [Methylomirabilota bacterium]|nr:hypothetical protein [Methylomirabilota bacterium]